VLKLFLNVTCIWRGGKKENEIKADDFEKSYSSGYRKCNPHIGQIKRHIIVFLQKKLNPKL
jgi:hypothetical protein